MDTKKKKKNPLKSLPSPTKKAHLNLVKLTKYVQALYLYAEWQNNDK